MEVIYEKFANDCTPLVIIICTRSLSTRLKIYLGHTWTHFTFNMPCNYCNVVLCVDFSFNMQPTLHGI